MKQQLQTVLEKFIPANEPQFTAILNAYKPQFYKRGDKLLAAGTISNQFFFIAQGSIRVYFLTPQGHEKTRHIGLENTIMTSLSSFIAQQPSVEIIEAMEDTHVMAISRAEFYHFVDTCRPWELFYRRILEIAYTSQTKRIENRTTLSAQQRFNLAMQETPEYFQRVSNRIMASYLDITQETLSRLKSK